MLVQGYNVFYSEDFSIEKLHHGDELKGVLGKKVPGFMSDGAFISVKVEDTYPDKKLGVLVVLKELVTGDSFIGVVNNIGEAAIFSQVETGPTTGNFDSFDSVQQLRSFLKNAKRIEDERKKQHIKPFSKGLTVKVEKITLADVAIFWQEFQQKLEPLFKKDVTIEKLTSAKNEVSGVLHTRKEDDCFVFELDAIFIKKVGETILEFTDEAVRFACGFKSLFNLEGAKARLKTSLKKLEHRDNELK